MIKALVFMVLVGQIGETTPPYERFTKHQLYQAMTQYKQDMLEARYEIDQKQKELDLKIVDLYECRRKLQTRTSTVTRMLLATTPSPARPCVCEASIWPPLACGAAGLVCGVSLAAALP
jgi:hypothetical protein